MKMTGLSLKFHVLDSFRSVENEMRCHWIKASSFSLRAERADSVNKGGFV